MNLENRVEKLEKNVDGIHEDIADLRDDMIKGFRDIGQRMDTKLDGIQSDLNMMKGVHAEAVTTRDPSLIADKLGYQFVSVLAREVLLGYGNVAKSQDKNPNDVESFKKADLVMLAQDHEGPLYLAVEASFTVHRRDVKRAIRNAAYLQEFTGIRAVGVVSGEEMMPDAAECAANNDVKWYELTDKDIQPE